MKLAFKMLIIANQVGGPFLMGLQAVRNGPGGPFLTGDHSAWNTGNKLKLAAAGSW